VERSPYQQVLLKSVLLNKYITNLKQKEGTPMHTPFPIIETDRLFLRKVNAEDAPDMLVYLSEEEVVQHMGLVPFQTIEDAMDEINWYDSIYEEGTGIRWGITLKEEGKVIGSCGYLNRAPKHHRAEIGFELSKDYWGKGIAREALDAVIRYGFLHLELERIEALIEPENIPSQKLVERKGFSREGLLRHYEYTRGKFDDLLIYSILKNEITDTHKS
jgi:[ribosomal protein S5]-alanine N-acetyltransferase